MSELTLSEKESVCIARHIKAYVEQCKHDEMSDFSEPCISCRFNQSCDFNAYGHFKILSENTGINITPLITEREKDHQVI